MGIEGYMVLSIYYGLVVVALLVIGVSDANRKQLRGWSNYETDDEYRKRVKRGARVALLAPVWPVWILVLLWKIARGFVRGVADLFRKATT